MGTWQLQEAKARLSEVIKKADKEGPQSITVHGYPTAVVISRKEYEQLKHKTELKRQVAEKFLSSVLVCSFDRASARKAALLFERLSKDGRMINENDLLIAGISLANDDVLFDRLVDGELAADERRRLLASLDDRPGGRRGVPSPAITAIVLPSSGRRSNPGSRAPSAGSRVADPLPGLAAGRATSGQPRFLGPAPPGGPS